MLRKSIIVAAIALLVGSMHLGAKEINIVPMPQSVEMGVGAFNLTAQTKVYAQGEGAAEVVRMFSEKIRTSSGLDLLQGKKAGKGTIAFVIDSKVTGKEAYVLSVKKDFILCKASTPAGLFYGMQSLLQLLPPEVEGTALNGKITGWTVPVCEIVDAPRLLIVVFILILVVISKMWRL
jgi:hexosaminidase